MSDKIRVKLYLDDNTVDGKPFSTRARAIARHEFNPRQHAGVRAAYIRSVKIRGVVEGVRGELWATQPSPDADGSNRVYGALTYGSLTEALYAALEEDPKNPQLLLTLNKGLEAKVLSWRTPPSVLKYLVKLHNRFHTGASTSFVELVQLIPEAAGLADFSA